MDEVYDCGDYLLLRRRGEEQCVPLRDIMNVSVSTHESPPRITLRLVASGPFGQEIVFVPAGSGSPFSRSAVGDDLIARVDRARRTP